jgi:hypothetical protein
MQVKEDQKVRRSEGRQIEADRKSCLITRALERHPGQTISYCGEAKCWDDCFTEEDGLGLALWYNVGKDTRVVAEKYITA